MLFIDPCLGQYSKGTMYFSLCTHLQVALRTVGM